MDFYLITAVGLILSIILMCILMPIFIRVLKNHNINQEVSEYALDEYKAKAKTPIMGGLLFVIVPVVVFAIINFKSLNNAKILMVIVSYLLFCLVGFLDDFIIIYRRDNLGLTPRFKLIMEFFFCIIIFFVFRNELSFSINIPIIHKTFTMPWYFYLPLIILMYLGEANAVNFTDGMDGLCAGVSAIALVGFSILTYFAKQYDLFILIACVIGGLIGYLFFNFHPAKIFMGDSGSLALGALFASIALVLNQEIVLLIIGGTFLVEMFCVCLQLSCVKLFHKRIFSYTPIHYAFTLKGYKEVKVVIGFYIFTLILTIAGVVIGLL